ncbi:TPA: DUF5339 family protein [Providencia stuartii]|uniref:DUF5339 family protein n=1 Tax=Providencia stuartii TaxID=588 RepID=UPI001140292C|nr:MULTISPECIES: DUF5339 family protein [Providencia]MBN5561018.1 hypothetical protein [Providencia stuartii]MBN5600703.1 hypothetical protein [Providencia stuartii]MBN5604726.1 hypothetical protein [Providencia stuartii]MCL8326822.1 DUF5339 domain-containing protein [Providencia thailandensis]MDF4174285.1 DUF5339 family protein [Providencia thailandensis]
MKKRFSVAFGVAALLATFGANAGKNCDTYFQEMNVLVKQAEEQYKNDPNVKERITEMKHQLEEAKKALADYPEDAQEQACEQGIQAIKAAKEAVEGK